MAFILGWNRRDDGSGCRCSFRWYSLWILHQLAYGKSKGIYEAWSAFSEVKCSTCCEKLSHSKVDVWPICICHRLFWNIATDIYAVEQIDCAITFFFFICLGTKVELSQINVHSFRQQNLFEIIADLIKHVQRFVTCALRTHGYLFTQHFFSVFILDDQSKFAKERKRSTSFCDLVFRFICFLWTKQDRQTSVWLVINKSLNKALSVSANATILGGINLWNTSCSMLNTTNGL